MLCDVLIIFHHWSAHKPVIHVASHVNHEKRVAWFSIFMHACGSVPIVMVFRLVAWSLA